MKSFWVTPVIVASMAACGGGDESDSATCSTFSVPTPGRGGYGKTPALSPDGKRVVFLSTSFLGGEGALMAFENGDQGVRTIVDNVRLPIGIAFSMDGERLFYSEDGQEIFEVPFAGGTPTSSVMLESQIEDLDFSVDGRTVMGQSGGDVVFFDRDSGDEINRISADTLVGPRLSPDGTKVAFFRTTENIWLLDVASGEITHLIDESRLEHLSRELAWLSDGLSLAVVLDGGVGLLEIDTLALRHVSDQILVSQFGAASATNAIAVGRNAGVSVHRCLDPEQLPEA